MKSEKKIGRPKGSYGAYKDVTKNVQIAFRVTEKQKSEIMKKAEDKGVSLSEYLLSVAIGY